MASRWDQDKPLRVDLVSRIFVRSFLLINLISLNASSVPVIPDPGVTVTPGSICCGDCITVTIPVENLRSVTFHGRIEIYIIDARGYTNPQNSLSITLSPKEKTSFPTVICPREPCNSFGRYQVIAKVVEDNGNVHDTDSAYFTVRDCGPSCETGWTQTYRCNGNALERLYVNDDCSEEWRTWEDCSPGVCKYGVCAPGGTEPPDDPGTEGTCNQWECQSRNKKIGGTYTKNGRLYQRYYECNCVDGNCKCERVEKEVPCEGTISGHVYNAETGRPISGAEVSCLGGQYPCYPVTDSGGFYRSCSCFCPSTSCDITCTAEGYESSTRSVTTDNYGNKDGVDFYLQPEISEVKFRGELIRGGEDESTQAISFYMFVVEITEILSDASGNLKVGDRVGISSHRDGKARVDIAYNGDTVEVFGINNGWDDSNRWYGSITDAHIVLSESPWDGEAYHLTLKAQGNRPPKLISLTPDKDAPQKAGTKVTWTVEAKDVDEDSLEYRFELKGPNSDDYSSVREWSSDNTWEWIPGIFDIGNNHIQVQVKDGKHQEIDDSTSQEYIIEIGEPINRPEYDDIRVLDYGYSYKAVFIKNKEIVITVSKYSNDVEGLNAEIYQLIPCETEDIAIFLSKELIQEGITRLAEKAGISIHPVIGGCLILYSVYELSEILDGDLSLLVSTSPDMTRYKVIVPEKTAEFEGNRMLQSPDQTSISGTFLVNEILADLDLKGVDSLKWTDAGEIELVLTDDTEIGDHHGYTKVIEPTDDSIEFRYEPLMSKNKESTMDLPHAVLIVKAKMPDCDVDGRCWYHYYAPLEGIPISINNKEYGKTNVFGEVKIYTDEISPGKYSVTIGDDVVIEKITKDIYIEPSTVIEDFSQIESDKINRDAYPKPIYTLVFYSRSEYRPFAHSIRNFISNTDFSAKTKILFYDGDARLLLSEISKSDLAICLGDPITYLPSTTSEIIIDNDEFKVTRHLKSRGQIYIISNKDEIKYSDTMEHATKYFINNMDSLYTS